MLRLVNKSAPWRLIGQHDLARPTRRKDERGQNLKHLRRRKVVLLPDDPKLPEPRGKFLRFWSLEGLDA